MVGLKCFKTFKKPSGNRCQKKWSETFSGEIRTGITFKNSVIGEIGNGAGEANFRVDYSIQKLDGLDSGCVRLNGRATGPPTSITENGTPNGLF